jgi:hypothetical protein
MPVFYRSLSRLPPAERDFLPHGKSGKIPFRPLTEAQLDEWNNGVSVYDDVRAAWDNAQRNRLGDYLAELDVRADGEITWSQTGRNPHHCSLRGDPRAMLAAIRRIVSRF